MFIIRPFLLFNIEKHILISIYMIVSVIYFMEYGITVLVNSRFFTGVENQISNMVAIIIKVVNRFHIV